MQEQALNPSAEQNPGDGGYINAVGQTGYNQPLPSDLTSYVQKSLTISTSAPLTGGGDLTANRVISMPAATSLGDGYMAAEDKAKLDNWSSVTGEFTGFSDPTAVIVSYDSTTRRVTLTGTVLAFWQGSPVSVLVSGWVSDAHAATAGPWFLFYDGSNFIWQQTPWTFDMLQIAYAYYGASDKFGIRECHGTMAWQVHEEFHRTSGTYKESGGVLGGYTLSSTTAALRRPSVTATIVHDEDIKTTVAALADNGPYTQMWLAGSANTFATSSADIVPLLAARPYWNSSGTQVLMSANKHMCVWLVAVPVTDDITSQLYRYLWIQGQEEGSLAEMQGKTFAGLNLGTLSSIFTEFVPIARVILKYVADWTIERVDVLSTTREGSLVNSTGLATVAVTAPITGDGTVASPLAMAAATSLVDGYITAVAFAAFTAKVSFPGFGTSGTTACVGNDSRLSNSRTPTAHVLNSASHTVSGLTTGHFLKALSATTFGFAAHGLTYTDVGAAPAATVSFPGFTATATDIKVNGAQSVGVLGTTARADHVHPVDTSRAALTGDTFTGTVNSDMTGVRFSFKVSGVQKAYIYVDAAEMDIGTTVNIPVYFLQNGAVRMSFPAAGGVSFPVGNLGFNGAPPISKPSVTGSRGGNAALASLLTALANLGLITDSSTA